MEPVYLFDLASAQQHWLAVRQATVAENVANANTPGYVGKDVAPFVDVLQQAQLQLSRDRARPYTVRSAGASTIPQRTVRRGKWCRRAIR